MREVEPVTLPVEHFAVANRPALGNWSKMPPVGMLASS